MEEIKEQLRRSKKTNTYGDQWTSTLVPTYEKQDCQNECSNCHCVHDVDVPSFENSNLKPFLTGYGDIDAFINDCLETMRVKGHDYRQGNDEDLLHNFRTVAETVDEPMMKVWYTYTFKHWAAITTFIKEGGQHESEPIEGRIKDMIVYLLLFYRMVQEGKTDKKLDQPIQKVEEQLPPTLTHSPGPAVHNIPDKIEKKDDEPCGGYDMKGIAEAWNKEFNKK